MLNTFLASLTSTVDLIYSTLILKAGFFNLRMCIANIDWFNVHDSGTEKCITQQRMIEPSSMMETVEPTGVSFDRQESMTV